jgi:hypothetical protein
MESIITVDLNIAIQTATPTNKVTATLAQGKEDLFDRHMTTGPHLLVQISVICRQLDPFPKPDIFPKPILRS